MTTDTTTTDTTADIYPPGSYAWDREAVIGIWVIACPDTRSECRVGRVVGISADGASIQIRWSDGTSVTSTDHEEDHLLFFGPDRAGYREAVSWFREHLALIPPFSADHPALLLSPTAAPPRRAEREQS